MDLKSLVMGVGLRDRILGSSPEHLHAEVLFLDQTNGPLYPLLFQLRKEVLENNQDLASEYVSLLPLPQGAIMMLGEVRSIDKKWKKVFLSDNSTVTYNHLVITTGVKERDQAFSNALQALIEALRVKKKIPTAFVSPYSYFKAKGGMIYQPTIEAVHASPLRNLEKIINEYLPKETERGQASLSETEKRLFYLSS